MSRREAWCVHPDTLLTALTGLGSAWFRYLASSDDPYSAVNHPWQLLAQHLHVLVAPLLVFAVGLIFRDHVWRHFRNGVAAKRRSGVVMRIRVAPMVACGYLAQTTTAELWRRMWIAVHLLASLPWVPSFPWVLGDAVHPLSSLWCRRRSKVAGGSAQLFCRDAALGFGNTRPERKKTPGGHCRSWGVMVERPREFSRARSKDDAESTQDL